ncbi:MAG TPA: hypothetical protein VJI12_02450 [archaeon]|nr:hypothetical protein [archaeon]
MDITNVFVLAIFMILFLFVAAVTGFGQFLIIMVVFFIVFAAITIKGGNQL